MAQSAGKPVMKKAGRQAAKVERKAAKAPVRAAKQETKATRQAVKQEIKAKRQAGKPVAKTRTEPQKKAVPAKKPVASRPVNNSMANRPAGFNSMGGGSLGF
jgi:hypothetical protein